MLVLSVTPEKAPDKETEITMTFEAGVPKTLNGKAMKVSEIITELNKLGGENGIGIIDIVENRVVGMKSRGVHETCALPISGVHLYPELSLVLCSAREDHRSLAHLPDSQVQVLHG